MAEDGRLNCIAKGIYTLPDTIPDELYILSLFSDNIIFSHETALFCNGLSERTPFEHSYTIPQGKRLSSSFSKGFKSYYCKQELFNMGKITANVVLQNFMMERFLNRLSVSEYKDEFVIKGGSLVSAMVGIDNRSTMDIYCILLVK